MRIFGTSKQDKGAGYSVADDTNWTLKGKGDTTFIKIKYVLYASIVLLTYIIFSPMHIFVVKIKMCQKDSIILAFQLEVSFFVPIVIFLDGMFVVVFFWLPRVCLTMSYRSYKAECRYICISDMNQDASFVGSRRVRNMDSLNPSKLSLDLIEIEYFFDTGT